VQPGLAAVHKYDCLVRAKGIMDSWNADYVPWGPNSNTVAHSFCRLCGIPFNYPDGSNPFGWWAYLGPEPAVWDYR
jgi:hypothetical protein